MSIQSIHRAAQIMSLFSLNQPSFGISEISRALDLHQATVQGITKTLVQEGFLRQDPATRKYQLGLKIYELGSILAGSLEINQKASSPAHNLAKRIQKLVRIATLDNRSALVTLDAYPHAEPFILSHFGFRAPLYCTAIGKAFLAFFDQREMDFYLRQTELISYTSTTITKKDDLLKDLEETRKRGYSINQEEYFFSRSAIGAPIFGQEGKIVASICITGFSYQILLEKIEAVSEEIKRTSEEISRYMGYFVEDKGIK